MPLKSPLSRREILILTGAALGDWALLGCGPSSSNAKERLGLSLNPTTLSTERGMPIAFLGSWNTPKGGALSFWGSADANGLPSRISQTLYWEGELSSAVRIQFDGQGLPTRMEQEGDGAFILLIWEDQRATFKLYQADGSYVGGVEVTPKGSKDFALAQLPDSATVGYYAGTLTGLTDAIVTFTVGGVVAGDPSTAARTALGVRSGAQRSASSEANLVPLTSDQKNRARAVVDALTGSVTQPAPLFAQHLLETIGKQFESSGKSKLGSQIIEAAARGSGVSPLYSKKETVLMGGLSSLFLLGQAAKRFQSGLQKNDKSFDDDSLRLEAASPSPVDYRGVVTYKTTRPDTDPTGIRGLVASRELGVVSMVGLLVSDAGEMVMSGTATTGEVMALRGKLTDGGISDGSWTLANPSGTPATGAVSGLDQDSGGSWDASPEPLGQCSVQENSGGQGLFSNTYDLGICGDFPFAYEAFQIPDQFQIFQDDNLLFDTGGAVSGGGTVTVTATGETSIVRVVVIASDEGTLWTYTLGCPEPDDVSADPIA